MAGYIGTQPVPQATQTRDAFTCTAGQTSFATSGYTPGFLDVYLNGIKLAAADYTASNGSDVVLASGAALDDILEVVAYTSFEVVTDTVTNAGTVLNLDRTGSDGTILDLKKDGTTVGSIGSYTGDNLTIGTDDVGLRFDAGLNTIMPHNLTTNANQDATVALGHSSVRFKDLYLSGGVYLGGTGAANKLDDYEEGTWSAVASATSATTMNTSNSTYTKIGRLVTCYTTVGFAGASGVLSVSGLPFTVNSDAGLGWGREDATSGYGIYYRAQSGTTSGNGYYMGAVSNATAFQVASGNFRLMIIYYTDS